MATNITFFPAQICLENQFTEMIPVIPWNDYSVFTLGDRFLLFMFDLAFIWITILMSYPESMGTRTEALEPIADEDGSGYHFDEETPMCAFTR
eukprot:SAG11_NODE_2218_length_3676_cov_3.617557_5_plen_93_part_00